MSSGLGRVGNVLAAASIRWDSIHYLQIAHHGYASAGDAVFFPLYPILLAGLGAVVGSDALAGILISLISFAAAFVLLHRLTELELDRRAADATVLLLAFAPMSFFFTAVYTESLFLALSVGAVYAARIERWPLACSLGGLAALTRVTGVLLIVPLALLYVRQRGRLDRQLAWVLLVPAGLVAFLGSIAAGGSSALAPFQQQAANSRAFTGPLDALAASVRAAAHGAGAIVAGTEHIYGPSLSSQFGPGAQSIFLLGVLALSLIALVACVRRLPRCYAAYSLLALFVTVWSPVAEQPLKSFDRYALTIFPLWMAAGAWLSERRLTRAVVMITAPLLALSTIAFARWSFIA
jgi:hypothetical protein